MTSNRLALNPYKTQALLISHYKITSMTISLAINNIPINMTSTAKYLDIKIDSTLPFTNQINKIEAKYQQHWESVFPLSRCFSTNQQFVGARANIFGNTVNIALENSTNLWKYDIW